MANARLPLQPEDLGSLRRIHLPLTVTERPRAVAAVRDLIETFHLAEPFDRLGFSAQDWTEHECPRSIALDELHDELILQGGSIQRLAAYAYPPPVLFGWRLEPVNEEQGILRFGFDLFYGAEPLHRTRWQGLQHRHALFSRATYF